MCLPSQIDHPQLTGFAQLGAAVGRVGDLDGDAVNELLVGSPGANSALLVSGPIQPGTWDVGVAEVLFEATTQTHVGERVAGAGDTDGDGKADLLITGNTASDGRAVYLFLGQDL